MPTAWIDARKTPSLRRTLAPIYPKLPFAKGSNRPEAGGQPGRATDRRLRA